MSRVSSEIIPWFGRFKAMILVDKHKIKQATFDTEQEAEAWCEAEMTKWQEVMRD